ncbi:MAG: hypothetical protein KAH32_07060 [Chlamydiia bacterium]|nr:hypothetical protein [Chlamydiia bacterium]
MKAKEIVICENCAGFGQLFTVVENDNTCTVCKGSGRLIKIITIAPFIPEVFNKE